MIICNHLRDGSIKGIDVEYHCKQCGEYTVVTFEGKMPDSEIAENKKLVESCLCRTHYKST